MMALELVPLDVQQELHQQPCLIVDSVPAPGAEPLVVVQEECRSAEGGRPLESARMRPMLATYSGNPSCFHWGSAVHVERPMESTIIR